MAPPKPNPLLVDYDAAKPWAVPFDPSPCTLVEVATERRKKNLNWLTTLDGLRLCATAYRDRLVHPDVWIALEKLLTSSKGAALPLIRDYAKAMDLRDSYVRALPPEPKVLPKGLKPAKERLNTDDGKASVQAFNATLEVHRKRFAASWAHTEEPCPDERGWLGMLEELPGQVDQYWIISTRFEELAAELGCTPNGLVHALRRERRLVQTRTGGRARNLVQLRTPNGRVRAYRIRSIPVPVLRPPA